MNLSVGDSFIVLLVLAPILLLLSKLPRLFQKKIQGVARVLDGDTIMIGQQKIRLFGIDAPETNQFTSIRGQRYAVGQMAAKFLREKVGQGIITCKVIEKDRYGRLVGVCKTAQGEDLSRLLVQGGMAMAYTRYSKAYRKDEQKARRRKTGLWAYGFQTPELFRQQNPY